MVPPHPSAATRAGPHLIEHLLDVLDGFAPLLAREESVLQRDESNSFNHPGFLPGCTTAALPSSCPSSLPPRPSPPSPSLRGVLEGNSCGCFGPSMDEQSSARREHGPELFPSPGRWQTRCGSSPGQGSSSLSQPAMGSQPHQARFQEASLKNHTAQAPR